MTLLALALGGCGGAGTSAPGAAGSTTSAGGGPAAPSGGVVGVVASGSPYAFTRVIVRDARGFEQSAQTDGLGRFVILPPLPPALVFNESTGDIEGTPLVPTPPTAFQVTHTDERRRLVGVILEGSNTCSVTPVSDLIVRIALGLRGLDLDDVVEQGGALPPITADELALVTAAVRARLNDAAADIPDLEWPLFDPLTTLFDADRRGFDALLDHLRVYRASAGPGYRLVAVGDDDSGRISDFDYTSEAGVVRIVSLEYDAIGNLVGYVLEEAVVPSSETPEAEALPALRACLHRFQGLLNQQPRLSLDGDWGAFCLPPRGHFWSGGLR